MGILTRSCLQVFLAIVAASTVLFAQSSGQDAPQNHASVADARQIVGPSVLATERSWGGA
jgi:hypothetical protein